MKIDFFLVGAAKSCTTSLYKMLALHPSIFVPNVKEINYFSQDILKETSLFKRIPTISEQSYYNLYSGVNDQVLKGDCSISYFQHQSVARRLYMHNPNAKIIVALRNPIERALSHYYMDLRLGYVNIGLEDILSNKDKYSELYHQYIKVSQYSVNFAKYLSYFPKDNMLIIRSEWMREHSLVSEKLSSFLNVDPDGFGKDKVVSNTSKSPKNALVAAFYKSTILRSGVRKLIPVRAYNMLKNALLQEHSSNYHDQKYLALLREILRKEEEYYLADFDYLEINGNNAK